MNDSQGPTETDERVRENRAPAPTPEIDPKHDDRSPLDIAFPEPKIEPKEHAKSDVPGG